MPRQSKKKRRKKNNRFTRLFSFDIKRAVDGFILAGIDEAGRGPLAGPVVACCLSLSSDAFIPGLDDSKKLSESTRESLYRLIKRNVKAIGIGIVGEKTIDKINILNATFLAMGMAFEKFKKSLAGLPVMLLVDGNMKVPGIRIPQESIVEGDSKSAAIAASSVIAKVTRDRIMRKFSSIYPEYNFSRNKGYCTAEHVRALAAHGPCGIHRMTFFPVSKSSGAK